MPHILFNAKSEGILRGIILHATVDHNDGISRYKNHMDTTARIHIIARLDLLRGVVGRPCCDQGSTAHTSNTHKLSIVTLCWYTARAGRAGAVKEAVAY